MGRGLSENFGERVKYYRTKKGLTFNEVQQRTGIDKSYVHKIESGRRKNPSYPIIRSLAEALGVGVSDLIEIDFKNQKNWLKPVQEILISEEYSLINNKLVTSTQREALVRLIDTILQAEWDESTMHTNTVDIISEVNQLLKLLR